MTYPELPNDDALIMGLLRDALGPTVRIRAEAEADMLDHLPYVMVETHGGPEDDPRFGGLTTVDVSCWSGDSRAACKAIAIVTRSALLLAVRRQTVRPEGHLSSYRLRAGPYSVPSGRTSVWRYLTTYELGTRPPATP